MDLQKLFATAEYLPDGWRISLEGYNDDTFLTLYDDQDEEVGVGHHMDDDFIDVWLGKVNAARAKSNLEPVDWSLVLLSWVD